MSFPRLSLVLCGLALCALGGFFLMEPSQVAELLDQPPVSRVLQAEFAAMYGGLELGLGVFFLVAAARSRWVRPALAAQFLMFSGLVLGRVVGLMLHNGRHPIMTASMGAEVVGALLGLIGFWRAKQMMDQNHAQAMRSLE